MLWALQTFRLDNAVACDELDLGEAAIYLAPWAILCTTAASDSLNEDARLQGVTVAFEMFRAEHAQVTAPRKKGGPVQRGGADADLTFADANQLQRVMNYCVAVVAGLFMHVGDVLLSRIGTHGVECHFGIIRSILRGVSSWRRWMEAETFAALAPGFRASFGLPRSQPSRSRVLPMGARVRRGDQSGAGPFVADEDELRAAARLFIEGEHPDLIRDYLYHLLQASGDVIEPAEPLSFAGMTSQARYMRAG
jgi:hypothetical protein